MKNRISIILVSILLSLFLSCNSSVNTEESQNGIHPQQTIENLLIERQKYFIEDCKKFDGIYENYLYVKHSEDAINSLKIIETIDVPQTKLSVVFYNFNLGTEIIRKTIYVIKENNNYYIYNQYFSSYDDDPFGNGKVEEGKELLVKVEKWESENDNIKWYK